MRSSNAARRPMTPACSAADIARDGRRVDGPSRPAGADRAAELRLLALLAVCVLVSVVMVLGLLYGLSPADPH